MASIENKVCAITTDTDHDTVSPLWYKQYTDPKGNAIFAGYLCDKHNRIYDLCAVSKIFLLKSDMTRNLETGATIGKVDYLGTNVLRGLASKLADPTINSNPMIGKNDLVAFVKLSDLTTALQNYAKTSDVNQFTATINTIQLSITALKATVDTLSAIKGVKTI